MKKEKRSGLITKRKKENKKREREQGETLLMGVCPITLDPSMSTRCLSQRVALPVRIKIIITAKMSGFSASTPGAFRAMCFRENSPMGLPISSSNVALQALATLEVPVTKHTRQGKWQENN